MAPAPPEPSTLPSWEAAFAHPLPVVRSLHTQLSSQISSNREKLRILVGSSYRDLLSTAEKIIEMETQIRSVEGNLGKLGRGCDSRMVGSSGKGLGRSATDEKSSTRLEAVARIKVAKGGVEAVGKIIRKGGDALVAAKVLGLVRLLVKSLEGAESNVALLQELSRRVIALRRRLLRHIDRTLAKSNVERKDLVNVLCAYGMVTSSPARNVLQHFLELRYEMLEKLSQEATQDAVLQTLELYSNTIMEVRDVFPRRLADALDQLAKVPLLQDPHVVALPELSLDVHAQWIPEDFRTITPFVYSNPLAATHVSEGLSAWSTHIRKLILQSVSASVAVQTELKAMLDFRHAVLMKFFTVSSKSRDTNVTETFDELRSIIGSQMSNLGSKASQLQLDLAPPSLGSTSSGRKSVWNLATNGLDSANGGSLLRKAVIDHRHGRDAHVQHIHSSLAAWSARLDDHWVMIGTMRSTKWETEDLDFDLDDVGYEGEVDLRTALNKDDPRSLEDALRSRTAEATRFVMDQVAADAEDGASAAYYIRALRELEACIGVLGPRIKGRPDPTSSMNKSLYEVIAKQACEQPLQDYRAASEKANQVVAMLWDGTPPLPVQPSPATFKFLTALQRNMADMGGDLWSRDAVEAVRRHVSAALTERLDARVEAGEATAKRDDGAAEAEAETGQGGEDTSAIAATGESMTEVSQATTQRLFDLLYLLHPLGGAVSALSAVIERLQTRAQLDEAAKQRLQKSAKEYWKRTYLLFGLLAAREL